MSTHSQYSRGYVPNQDMGQCTLDKELVSKSRQRNLVLSSVQLQWDTVTACSPLSPARVCTPMPPNRVTTPYTPHTHRPSPPLQFIAADCSPACAVLSPWTGPIAKSND